jgi:uncharacterized membrane protein
MGANHPQVVHFAIALVFAGVAFRLVSLTRLVKFTSPAAMTLILAGTVACFAAVQTGTTAHEPVEQIPGVRNAVLDHQTWGERARDIFTIVSAMEVVALFLGWRQHRFATAMAVGAAITGAVGLGAIYQAASRGGALVYSYAGGVGTSTGDTVDVNRLFIAAAYQQALQDREAGRVQEAMTIVDLAAARFPANLDLQLLGVEWTTDLKQDPAAAIAWLDRLQIPPNDTGARVRAGVARANALAAQGNRDGAMAVLRTLQAEFPENPQVQRRLGELATGPISLAATCRADAAWRSVVLAPAARSRFPRHVNRHEHEHVVDVAKPVRRVLGDDDEVSLRDRAPVAARNRSVAQGASGNESARAFDHVEHFRLARVNRGRGVGAADPVLEVRAIRSQLQNGLDVIGLIRPPGGFGVGDESLHVGSGHERLNRRRCRGGRLGVGARGNQDQGKDTKETTHREPPCGAL